MNYPLIVALCFLPLAIIIIITKLSLLFSSSVEEAKYVKEESKKPHGPYLDNVYEDIDREEETDRDF